MFTLYLILIVAAIAMQAFFTSSEMAFTSADKLRLKHLAESGDKKAIRLMNFLNKEGMFLATTLVGTNICIITSSTLATRIFIEYFGDSFAPLFAICVMVPVSLVFGDITPKMIARHFATPLSLRMIGPLESFFMLFRPFIVAVNSIARVILAPFGARKKPWDFTFTKSDLKRLMLMGHETGEVNADEVEMIHKVLDLGGVTVERIMIPMYRVSSISHDESIGALKKIVAMTGFSRIPVRRPGSQEVAGIVNIYDVIFSCEANDNSSLEDFMREPVCLDKEDPLDIALTRLRNRKQPMGIVLGPDKNPVGVVTIEDILEEIVGEIEDEGGTR